MELHNISLHLIQSYRCDGQYKLVVCAEGDVRDVPRICDGFKLGYLCGMSADQIMYATQASQYIEIFDMIFRQTKICRAYISLQNSSGRNDEFYVEFSSQDYERLKTHFNLVGFGTTFLSVYITFIVKYSYFRSLRKSVKCIKDACIMPNDNDFDCDPELHEVEFPFFYPFLELDNECQLPALKKVLFSKSSAPILVSGAFGTGKTRLLAVAAYFFIEQGKQQSRPTRILVCCHHQHSADTFIEQYFGRMVEDEQNHWRVKLVRLGSAHHTSTYKQFYVDQKEFKEAVANHEYINEKYLVVVSTSLTALSASDVIGDRFFTHILLDEGAQAQEPEAIAPLCMANHNTKIVITGDDRQVRCTDTLDV